MEKTDRGVTGKKVLMYVSMAGIVFLFLYCSTLQDLFRAWLSNEDYNHGLLILPLSLFLIWSKRKDLMRHPLRPSRMGIPLLLLWAVLFILGVGAHISTFERVSLIVFLLGCILTVAGRAIMGILMFPVLFLVFMIPIPSEIYSALTNPLALLATTCSASIMKLASIPVFQEGNLILLPNSTMEVLDVCSGVRSLVSIVALALLIGYRVFSSLMETLCLLIMSVPVSIAGNIARITVTGIFTYEFPSRFSFMDVHAIAGISSLILSFVLLISAGGAIRWVGRKRMQYISWCLR